MVISWCLAEIPRYLFYMFNLAFGSIPFPLFWWRYSAFMLLYPTGITGEIFQIIECLPYWGDAMWARILRVILVLYLPGSPFMIGNMWGNRKSAFRKRKAAANPRPVCGLVWPVTNAKTGERSTSKTNKDVWVDAVGAVDEKAQTAARKEKNWRYGYVRHVEANVRASLRSPGAAIKVAEAGLEAAQKKFEFVRGDATTSLKEAMDTYTDATMEKFVINKGGASASDKEKAQLKVAYAGKVGTPYYLSKENRKNEIQGEELSKQLATWVEYGVIEESCRKAIQDCIDNPGWLDLSKHYFVLLGAGSAMGPLQLLLSLGANIYAVDIDRQGTWERLINLAKASRGEFTFPIKKSKLKGRKPSASWSTEELAAVAGANL